MNIIFNTANPIIILVYTLIISGIIFLSRKSEKTIFPIILTIYMIVLLILHSTLKITDDTLMKTKYISIAFDLIFLFLSFISFLWIDDINARKKNLKSYDNSLSWFWDEL
ncbi:MAG: hypothetical protein ACI4UE_01590 [Candidatus Scatovivens sp.]